MKKKDPDAAGTKEKKKIVRPAKDLQNTSGQPGNIMKRKKKLNLY